MEERGDDHTEGKIAHGDAVLIGILLIDTTMTIFPCHRPDVVNGLVLLVAPVFSFTLSRRTSRFMAAVPL